MSQPEKSDALPPPSPYDREASKESSTTDFGIDFKDLITTATSDLRTFDFTHTKSHVNIRIIDKATGDILYYVDNSSFTPGKADVTLCKGRDKEGPIQGVCRWSNMYSKQFTMGLGDTKHDASNTSWEQVQTEHTIHPAYQWSTGLPGARKTFAWHRIRGDDIRSEDGDANSWSGKNFKLVDISTDEVLAVFASYRMKSWSNLGRLTFKIDGRGKGWGEEWELHCLLSILGLIEMSRRRGRSRRSAPGGGGGS